MIHWQNGPNDRAQAFRIGGAFNSQMYMGGVLVAVQLASITFAFKNRITMFTLNSRITEFQFAQRDMDFSLKS